jgi:23S rRNA (cytidine1920-2'-O)/16S rRNA (cytidine1409-2'-O)-methyltransferase
MKARADQLLVDRGLAESRAKAQALILAGLVFSGERKIDKAGQALADDAPLEVRGKEHPWVSRGGVKLAHALEHFGWDVTGAVALDVGSSTGGFTDVLLQQRRRQGVRGRRRAPTSSPGSSGRIRGSSSTRKTNARYLTDEAVTEPVDMIVCDASFISLAKVLDRALDFAKPDGRLIALVKPQFEAGREEIGKSGVVRDPAVHARVCDAATEWVRSRGWSVEGVVPSPITGSRGQCRVPARRAAAGGKAKIRAAERRADAGASGRSGSQDRGYGLSAGLIPQGGRTSTALVQKLKISLPWCC